MGEISTMITTAWSHIQTAYSALVTAEGIPVPKYDVGVQTAMSRLKYPVLIRAKDYARQETRSMLGEELQVALDLVLVHTAQKPETLETNSLGYMDCLLEMIRDDHTFGGACHIGEFTGSEFFDASGNDRAMEIVKISILLRKEVQI